MEVKTTYFTKICYNLDEYIEYISTLTFDDGVLTKLISVIEIDNKIVLTFKQSYVYE